MVMFSPMVIPGSVWDVLGLCLGASWVFMREFYGDLGNDGFSGGMVGQMGMSETCIKQISDSPTRAYQKRC